MNDHVHRLIYLCDKFVTTIFLVFVLFYTLNILLFYKNVRFDTNTTTRLYKEYKDVETMNVDVSSMKTYLPHLRDYCAPGSFVRSNNADNKDIYQILSVATLSDCRMLPSEMRNVMHRSPISKMQVVKVAIFKPINELDIDVPPLRRREFEDVIEYILTDQNSYITNDKLGCVCFLHKTSDVLEGKYDCLGLNNVYVIRYSLCPSSNLPNEIENFNSFPDELQHFHLSHATDLSRLIWNGVESVKDTLCSVLCKSVEREGASFNSSKSTVFHLTLIAWNYIKYQLKIMDANIKIESYTTRSRIRKLKYGIKYTSKTRDRKWECIRLETNEELNCLKKLLGPYCLIGVTKERPSKGNNYEVLLNRADLLNIVEPVESKDAFKRRNVTTFGVDLMFCLGIGGKVWARYCNKVARDIPVAMDLMRSMEATPEFINTNNNGEELAIEPGVSVFYYENCALQVNSITNDIVSCVVMHSSNRRHKVGNIIDFNDIEYVRDQIASAFNT